MRILIVGVYGDLPGTASGTETYTRLLATELSRRGHSVTVASRSPRGEIGSASGGDDGQRLAPIPEPRWRVRRIAGSLEGRRVHGAVRDLAAEIRADVIHATHLDLAPRSTVPIVVTAWDPETSILARMRLARKRGYATWHEAWHEALYALTDGWACRRAAAVIAPTPAVHRALQDHAARLALIPAFVSDDVIQVPPPHRSHQCVMAANGIDAPLKGLDLALEAVRRARSEVPDMRLVLLGSWVDPGRMDELPDFCDVRGPVPRPTLAEILRGAGCCLFPSLWEEFGYVGLEALAAGTPLVCGPLPGFAELRCDGIVLAGERTPNAFAEALSRAVGVEEFAFPDECRASSAVPRIVELYDAVVGGGTAPPSGSGRR